MPDDTADDDSSIDVEPMDDVDGDDSDSERISLPKIQQEHPDTEAEFYANINEVIDALREDIAHGAHTPEDRVEMGKPVGFALTAVYRVETDMTDGFTPVPIAGFTPGLEGREALTVVQSIHQGHVSNSWDVGLGTALEEQSAGGTQQNTDLLEAMFGGTDDVQDGLSFM